MLELPELPEIKDASTSTLGMGLLLDKRLPDKPVGPGQELSLRSGRAEEAEQLMNDIRASYAISRAQSKRSRARAKARNRQAQRQAERR